MGTLYPSLDSDIAANDVANVTVADCLIDNKMAMVAVASAGGVIVCLLVSTLVLAWQVRQLHQRIGTLRPSRSNMDLARSSGCTWPLLAASHDPSDPREAGGLEGPCDAAIVLEEMRPFLEIDATEDQVNTEKEKGREQGEKQAACRPGEMAAQMSSSMSDARLDSKDLENMPLVV